MSTSYAVFERTGNHFMDCTMIESFTYDGREASMQESAISSAKRYARRNPGKIYFVAKTLESYEYVPPPPADDGTYVIKDAW